MTSGRKGRFHPRPRRPSVDWPSGNQLDGQRKCASEPVNAPGRTRTCDLRFRRSQLFIPSGPAAALPPAAWRRIRPSGHAASLIWRGGCSARQEYRREAGLLARVEQLVLAELRKDNWTPIGPRSLILLRESQTLKASATGSFNVSGRQDLNLRPPGPQPGAGPQTYGPNPGSGRTSRVSRPWAAPLVAMQRGCTTNAAAGAQAPPDFASLGYPMRDQNAGGGRIRTCDPRRRRLGFTIPLWPHRGMSRAVRRCPG